MNWKRHINKDFVASRRQTWYNSSSDNLKQINKVCDLLEDSLRDITLNEKKKRLKEIILDIETNIEIRKTLLIRNFNLDEIEEIRKTF